MINVYDCARWLMIVKKAFVKWYQFAFTIPSHFITVFSLMWPLTKNVPEILPSTLKSDIHITSISSQFSLFLKSTEKFTMAP